MGPSLLNILADAHPAVTFVEIGAHDGERSDLLRPLILAHGWTGVMVEPAPHLFEQLARNYGDVPGVALENAAISDADGQVPFHFLAPVDDPVSEGLPDWYDEIGSLSRETVLRHSDKIADLEDRLVAEDVACMRFETLCRKHEIGRLDLLAIDAEGHDWTILRGVDFAAHRPRLVVYESVHLPPENRAQARSHLKRSGYETHEEAYDTWCLHRDAGDRLLEAWQGLHWRVAGISVNDPA